MNISSKAVFRALITNQWDIARQAIEKQSELSGLQLLVSMHSALISDAPMTREIFWKWLHGEISKDVKPLLEVKLFLIYLEIIFYFYFLCLIQFFILKFVIIDQNFVIQF